MEFENLKNSLEYDLRPAYLINGGESLLTRLALKTIENSLNICLKDFNIVYFNDTFRGNIKDVIASFNILPMSDNYRLVVVYDFIGKKSENDKKAILEYLKHPNLTTCVIFFSTNKSDFFSSLEGKLESIDCSKVSLDFTKKYIVNFLTKKNLSIGADSINKLIEYCNKSITKIDVELEKLSNLKVSGDTITGDDIENYVTKDIEYVIFDLSNAISEKNKNKVYLLINAMIKNKEQPLSIVNLLTNHFRRLFFISRSIFEDKSLSEYLGIKEYAIKKYREQLRLFTQRQLKKIYDECVNTEFKVKSGKMEAKNAVYYLVSTILS